ncbi:RHS repeat-associated core domain-containing protein [Shewanella nanhaiensis]|uniref:RHS repeat-associated core domain-containing protein n=1 Tax=Shewanella nanhaiensis TaxID=2864872 RepID=UPI001E591C14|nr:RHS repeat-associated core domain-containing protein [Shewanella nanhaiensis]
MKILTFTRFAINSFVAFVLSVASLSFQAEASQGQTVFIPISVGDITTFIPIMPSSSTGSVASTTTDGSYNLNWSAVTNASYYQIIITDEDGKKRIIKVFGTSYDLAGLSLGSNTIEVQACNANHQCGVGYLAGTVSRSSKVTYQHTDMLGTPVMETDESGQIASRSVYEPFGKRLGGEKEGIGFTGHLQDEDLGLTYMQARYYDPLIGRFYSNDPLAFRDIHSFNRYAYANNNPYKYIDPTGEVPEFVSARQMARNIGGSQGVATFDQAANEVGMEASGANDLINAATSLANGDTSGAALSVAMAVNKPLKAADKIQENIKRFTKKVPANAKDNIEQHTLPDGGVAVQATSPGIVPGSKAVYEKQIDSSGTTIQATKTTYDPKGNIVHVKDKLNGGTYQVGEN